MDLIGGKAPFLVFIAPIVFIKVVSRRCIKGKKIVKIINLKKFKVNERKNEKLQHMK